MNKRGWYEGSGTLTGDPEVVAEEGAAEGADDAGEDEVGGDPPLVLLRPPAAGLDAGETPGHLPLFLLLTLLCQPLPSNHETRSLLTCLRVYTPVLAERNMARAETEGAKETGGVNTWQSRNRQIERGNERQE